MGLMGNLRNRAGLVIFIIGLAIVAFLLGDIIQSGTPFWAKKQNEIGSVNGNSMDYHDFNAQVEQTSAMYQQQMGGAETPQIKNFAVQQVWNQFISKELMAAEIEKLGLSVGKKEFNDLITGPNPSPQIMQTFTNPETGQFDRNYLTQVINEAKGGNVQVAQQWELLLENIRTQRLTEKYSNLLSNSIYVTALEAQDEYTAKNKLANFKYVLLDYSTVNEADIKLTDADYAAYYDKHKNAFKNQEETRSIEYVLFDASPTAKDSSATLAAIQTLKEELVASTNDSLFVVSSSDNKYPVTYYRKGQVSPALDSVIFNAAKGITVGPFLANGAYEIAKIIDSKFSPDSVKASHILLNAAAEGGVAKAKAKADSIKGLLAKGESFSSLAVEFSQDPGSKANGGDLGTFTRGQMVGPFEEAAFNGKTGDVVVVESQFGVHILKIEKQIGNSKIVKAAILDKVITAGKETTDAVYNKANSFFTAANGANFAETAKKENLNLQKATRVQPMDNSLNGAEASRELIRWVFDAKNGDVSDKIYETENSFIVAKVTSINPKGIQPLNAIKGDIELGVKNLVKARMLKEKMNNALNGATSIDQVAQKAGKAAIAVENIVLANPVIPGVSLESTVIGTVFGLQPNKPSKAIEGTQGIYVVQVDSFVNPKEMVDTERKNQQKQMLTSKQQRSWGSIFKALQDNAKIDDNRIRFY
ncbi:peptidylprolyl isomerase [Sphingobacterium faecale]|uniref:Periplasmic chaperone PpiD n=1 Tax=Sphingobacterium faecale TaxID=2803775 RepID=A0ABS1R8T9_9SPHI|nr:SurA N-terminal domain-containing protein [Sphingobacterium faecale]MBL1410940.1 SurA N-terminal domain-containing protein [Sphingobacterium faecale]